MKNLLKLLLNFFNSSENSNLMTIDELRDINLRKEKIKKAIKSRAFISEINQKYNNMNHRKKINFLKKASWYFKKFRGCINILMCKVFPISSSTQTGKLISQSVIIVLRWDFQNANTYSYLSLSAIFFNNWCWQINYLSTIKCDHSII